MPCSAPARDDFSFDIDIGGQAPGIARRTVGTCLAGRVASGTLEQIELLVSELVSNVVRHAATTKGDALTLDIHLIDDGVRVEVFDGDGDSFDPRPAPDAERGRGYGLFLVESLSRRWGVDHVGGTRVWFELALAS